MTYNVFGGTLNLAHSINLSGGRAAPFKCISVERTRKIHSDNYPPALLNLKGSKDAKFGLHCQSQSPLTRYRFEWSNRLKTSSFSGGARGHPDEGAAFPDGGGLRHQRPQLLPPSGVWGGN